MRPKPPPPPRLLAARAVAAPTTVRAQDSTGERPRELLRVGRYDVADRIAAGGMATVHIGRLRGAAGFARVVAVKRLLQQFVADPDFERMFMEEARLAARIQHTNVVSTLDVVACDGELLLVMDYVQGESLWRLMAAAQRDGIEIPLPIVSAIISDVLQGLNAAHCATSPKGEPLGIVHRDMSPQNVIVGVDGVAQVLDFGIAKAADSTNFTQEGSVRGKTAYMAPEQLLGNPLSGRTDIYAVGVMLWELWTGTRLFGGKARPELLSRTQGNVRPPSEESPKVTREMDAVALKALALDPARRFQTALEMCTALERIGPIAGRATVAAWVKDLASEALATRAALAARIEAEGRSVPPPATKFEEPTFVDRGKLLQSVPRLELVDTGSSKVAEENADSVATRALSLNEAGMASGVSSLSASWATASPLSPSRVALGLGVVALLVSAFLWSGRRDLAVATGAMARPLPAAAEFAVMSLRQSEPIVLPPTLVVVSEAADEPEPTAPDAKTLTSKKRKAVARPRTRKRAAKSSCNPPYTVDAAGRHHYKKECF